MNNEQGKREIMPIEEAPASKMGGIDGIAEVLVRNGEYYNPTS